MCKFCKMEPEDLITIAEHKAKIMCGRRQLGEERLTLYHWQIIDGNDKTRNYIEADFCVDNTCEGIMIKAEIKFCPFCGRKLHND